MGYASLREYIEKLEELGELKRIKEEVDWKYELGAWVRYCYDQVPGSPALLFENVKGYDKQYKVLCNAVGTYRKFAIALGEDPNISKQELINVFSERLKGRIKPNLVKTGPVQENVHLGKDINLFEFPVPWWNPRDGGRFIGCWHGVVSKDPDTGTVNVGMYRVQVHDKGRCTVGALPGQHMNIHFAKQQLARKPLDVAVVIGGDESIPIMAATGVPYSVCEYDVMGSLRGEPLPLVKCKTVDLEVPANAEIVIEGKLHTDVQHRIPEGPFSEYLGYSAGHVRMRPVMDVTCITHRDAPILRGSLGGKPPTEWCILLGLKTAAQGLTTFAEQGPSGVKAINSLPEAGGNIVTVIQMSPYYVGHSWQVARAWLVREIGKWSKVVIVVDEDIDPFNLGEVLWAVGSRTQGKRDIEVWPFCPTGRSDPSVPRTQGEYTDRVIIDATKKLDYAYEPIYEGHWAPVAVPPKRIMDLVALKWRKAEGEIVSKDEIDRESQELEDVHYKRWEEWREKNYVLTPEEKERELPLSYARLGEHVFE